MKILPIGSVLITDQEGNLVSQSAHSRIVKPWKQAIDDIVQVYKEHFSENLYSIYVRGSVARGRAIESFSDIDTLAVLHTSLNEKDYAWCDITQKKLENLYPFASSIGHDFIVYDDIIPKNNEINGVSFSYSFTIKTQCVCVYGKDLTDLLPEFKPDKMTALFLLTNLRFIFCQIKNEFFSNINKKRVRHLCRWVSKIIIRNAFLLVMEKEKVFTRDLYPCCQIFSKYFPDQGLQIRKAMEYAINPIADIDSITYFLDNFGVWLMNKIEEEFNQLCRDLLRK